MKTIKDARIKVPMDEDWFLMEVRRGLLVIVNAIESKRGMYPRTSQLRTMYRSGRIENSEVD